MPRRVLILAVLALAVPLVSCGDLMPGDVDGPVQMVVIDFDRSTKKYALAVREVRTLKRLRTLEGDAVRVLAGAELTEDIEEIIDRNITDEGKLEELLYQRRPRPVDFSAFETGGVLYPEDFHSLNMATVYYHFERAHLFFAGLGAKLPQLPVLYFPTLRNPDATKQTDNAYYDPLLRTFGVLEFDELKDLPLGMNAGIVAHEYAHAVFDNRVFPEDGLPWLFANWIRNPNSPELNRSMNVSRSFNEGFADFLGAALTNDPAFLDASIPQVGPERRLNPEQPRCIGALREVARMTPHVSYSPYELGSVIAAALWESTGGSGPLVEATAKGVVDSMAELEADYKSQTNEISIELHVEALGRVLDSSVRAAACGHLLDRLGLSEFQIPSCTGSRRPEKRCGS